MSRATSNKGVAQCVYNAAVEKWVNIPPNVALRTKMGPILASDCRQVTPEMTVIMAPLLEYLFVHGCDNGTLQQSKLRHAMLTCLKTNKPLQGTACINDILRDFEVHTMSILSMLRAYKREMFEGTVNRSFPKSGGFRKKLSAKDIDVVDSLVSHFTTMEDDTDKSSMASDCDSFPSCFHPTSSTATSSHISPLTKDPNDDDWPKCSAVTWVPLTKDPDGDAKMTTVTTDWPACFPLPVRIKLRIGLNVSRPVSSQSHPLPNGEGKTRWQAVHPNPLHRKSRNFRLRRTRTNQICT